MNTNRGEFGGVKKAQKLMKNPMHIQNTEKTAKIINDPKYMEKSEYIYS